MTGAAELRKRAGMLWSKHRFLAVQWQAYLSDGLWLRLAHTANARARSLAQKITKLAAGELVYPAEANEIFIRLPERAIDRLEADGFGFYRYGDGVIRLVASFATSEAEIETFIGALTSHLEQEPTKKLR
jgi:threonine aldolase